MFGSKCIHDWIVILKTYDTVVETTSILLKCLGCGKLENKVLNGKELETK